MPKSKLARKQRTPVGGPRNILTVANKDPNYVYRFVKDEPGRIDLFKEGGYEVVTQPTEVGDSAVNRHSQLGSAVTVVRGTSTLVLMRIPKEWYDEDQASKQEEIDALEATMRSGNAGDYGKIEIASRK